MKILVLIIWWYKVDEIVVDTSNSMESSIQWIQALEAWACHQLWIKIK